MHACVRQEEGNVETEDKEAGKREEDEEEERDDDKGERERGVGPYLASEIAICSREMLSGSCECQRAGRGVNAHQHVPNRFLSPLCVCETPV